MTIFSVLVYMWLPYLLNNSCLDTYSVVYLWPAFPSSHIYTNNNKILSSSFQLWVIIFSYHIFLELQKNHLQLDSWSPIFQFLSGFRYQWSSLRGGKELYLRDPIKQSHKEQEASLPVPRIKKLSLFLSFL